GLRRGDPGLDAGRIGHVKDDGNGAAVRSRDLARNGSQRIAPPAGQRHLGAGPSERDREMPAESAGSSGDEGHLPRYVTKRLQLRSGPHSRGLRPSGTMDFCRSARENDGSACRAPRVGVEDGGASLAQVVGLAHGGEADAARDFRRSHLPVVLDRQASAGEGLEAASSAGPGGALAGIQLNPGMAPGGMDRRDYLAAKFGGETQATRVYDAV